MKQNFIDQIESKLATLEVEAANKAVSSATMKKNIKEVKKFIDNTINLSKSFNEPFSEDEMSLYTNRINQLMEPYTIGYVSSKILKSKKAVAALITAIGVSTGIAGVSIAGCGESKEEVEAIQETETEEKDILDQETIMPREEIKVEPTTMDVEYKEMSDEIVASMNDAISKGFEVTEDNKLAMSKMYTEYYMLNQMDTLTDEQWANVFQNSTTTAKDLMNAKENLEWIDEQRVTVADKDMLLDYSHMFEGADLKLLTDAEDLISEIKTTTGTDKKQAIRKFKEYIIEKLGSNNERMQYSERAMDTFRAVYFDSFDTLTNGKEIDDELEHAVNTTITCSLVESNLDVEDKTIKSLQSDYQTYLLEKLEVRLENGWIYISNNDINPYNDINEISKYVSENIDLSLYKEMPDYEETLVKMFATGGAKKSKDDSGVSNGQTGENAGNISLEQLQQYNIDPASPTAREELEQAVQEDTKQKEEDSIRVTDENDNVLEGTVEDNKAGYKAGYEAAMNGKSKPAHTGNKSYDAGLDNGYADGLADLEELSNSLDDSTETKTEPVDEGEVIKEETDPVTEDYVEEPSTEKEQSEDNSNDIDDNYTDVETEFVPIDESQPIDDSNSSESEVVTEDYTDVQTEFVPIDDMNNSDSINDEIETAMSIEEADASIEELRELRDYLTQFVSVEESEKENQIVR